MRAVRLWGTEDIRVDETPEPFPGPGQVKLRNAYSGICGSDLHLYYAPDQGGLIKRDEPHPLTGAVLPQVLGHEFSGQVVELGKGVSNVAIGDTVAVLPLYYCGQCAACKRGHMNLCRSAAFHGVNSMGGGMSEFTAVPAAMLHTLPEAVDLRMGALVEPMAVGWHAVTRARVTPHDTALVVGAGPIGFSVFFALRAHGIKTIVISEPSEVRRDAIRNAGAEIVIDPTTEDLTSAVGDATDWSGVDVAFDCAGGPAVHSILQSDPARRRVPRVLAPSARVVVLALSESPFSVEPITLIRGEVEIFGSMGYLPRDYGDVITAMADGKYDLTGWVDEVPFENAADAIRALHAGKGIKFLVRS